MKLESIKDGLALCGLIYGASVAFTLSVFPLLIPGPEWDWSISLSIVLFASLITIVSILYFWKRCKNKES